MKYLKTYENIQERFKIDDYVIANPIYFKRNQNIGFSDDTLHFLKNNIGQIMSYKPSARQCYRVKYDSDIPDARPDSYNTWYFTADEIRLATPEEIQNYELKISTKKYNL